MPAEAFGLAGLLGVDVVSGGVRLGRLHDVAARVGGPRWPVVGLRIGARDGPLDVPWSAVRTIEPDRIEVALPARAGAVTGTWLAAGVLDRSLIDVDGRRVVRVGDVLLERTEAGLAAIAIELGAAAVLRRLGLWRIARRLRRNLLGVAAVHVPHGQHDALAVTAARDRLGALEAHELAELLDRLPRPAAHHVLATLDPAHARRTGERLAHRHATRRLRRRHRRVHPA